MASKFNHVPRNITIKKHNFVNVIGLIFGSVNNFENVVRRQRNVSELLLNFIRVFLIPECDDTTSSNFELGSHLHFTSKNHNSRKIVGSLNKLVQIAVRYAIKWQQSHGKNRSSKQAFSSTRVSDDFQSHSGQITRTYL